MDEIHRSADQFRRRYWDGRLPVDVLGILEFDLGMEIVPVKSLKMDVDVDALLLGDFRTMLLDQDEYMDERFENRLRFSVAHELGHLVLHRDLWQGIPIRSIEEWVRFVRDLPEDEWRWFENHANEFAGRLLVPPDLLGREFRANVRLVPKEVRDWDPTGDSVRQYLANRICKAFGVSEQVIERRLQKERLLP